MGHGLRMCALCGRWAVQQCSDAQEWLPQAASSGLQAMGNMIHVGFQADTLRVGVPCLATPGLHHIVWQGKAACGLVELLPQPTNHCIWVSGRSLGSYDYALLACHHHAPEGLNPLLPFHLLTDSMYVCIQPTIHTWVGLVRGRDHSHQGYQ